MYPVEPAVREDHEDVRLAYERPQAIDDRADAGFVIRGLAHGLEVGHHALGVEPILRRELLEPRDLREHHAVGFAEGARQLVLENGAPRGIRARLEDGP